MPDNRETGTRVTYSAMAQPTVSTHSGIQKTTATVATQTDVTNCTCKTNYLLTKQQQDITKENNSKKQAAIQTENVESAETEASAQGVESCVKQGEEGWTTVGRPRCHSLSPRARGDQNQRGRAGEPPDKQPRQSPKNSGDPLKKMEDKVLGSGASGIAARSQAPRQRINYPK